jgi:S1-C subfamily serine protease
MEMSMNPPAASTGTLTSLSNDLADAVASASTWIVAIHARRRIPSSGIVWQPGVIVTANHTVSRDEEIRLTLPDGSSAPATLAGRDPATDIAVLRTDAKLAAADRADPDHLQVGRLVLAVGRPGPEVTATLGIVSAVGGEWRTWHGGRIDRFIRLDLSIYDGFSGGALVEAGGRVLGLNTSGLARAMALALPQSTVQRVTDELLQRGRVARGYLGVAMQPVRLPRAMRQKLELNGAVGLVIVNLETGGPAERAGLLLGDLIIGIEGHDVSDPSDLLRYLGSDSVGRRVNLSIIRAGEIRTVGIEIGERPSPRSDAS